MFVACVFLCVLRVSVCFVYRCMYMIGVYAVCMQRVYSLCMVCMSCAYVVCVCHVCMDSV